MLDDFTKANLAMWNELVDVHAGSTFYDLEGFRRGRETLRPGIEREELAPHVAGRRLLHLMCHFGLDTLSLARHGATVTGADFSDKAIALARRLADEVGLADRASFVRSDVYALPDKLQERFDIVFTSWGVLTWLGDLTRWANVAAHFLEPGGTFYMAEFHPFVWTLDDGDSPSYSRPAGSPPPESEVRLGYPYFNPGEPLASTDDGDYADPAAHVSADISYEWPHSLGEIVSALLAAGLRLDYLHEFPFTHGLRMPYLVTGDDGRQRVKGHEDTFPLSFSLRMTKDGPVAS